MKAACGTRCSSFCPAEPTVTQSVAERKIAELKIGAFGESQMAEIFNVLKAIDNPMDAIMKDIGCIEVNQQANFQVQESQISTRLFKKHIL